jgi:hypothetical protein
MDTNSRESADCAPIDENTIQELREEGGELLSDVVAMFIEEVPGQLAMLDAAWPREMRRL